MRKLLIFSNLYPSPWAPQMATFNFQQFRKLSELFDTLICVPVPFWVYFKYIKDVKQSHRDKPNVIYFPYFFTPKIGRQFYGRMMFLSVKFSVFRSIKAFRPDACFTSWVYPDGYAGKAIANVLNIPIIVKAHGSDVNVYTQDTALRLPTINVLKTIDSLVSVSQAIATKVREFDVPKENVNVVYNGVDKEKFYPIDGLKGDTTRHIVFIGNLKTDKGIFELYDAFKQYVLPLGNAVMHFIGGGGNLNVLSQKIQADDLSDQIIMHGSLSHDSINEWMNKAAVVCLPSYHEGVPNVLLEAMSTGTPVVATSVGGIPEVVPEFAGILVEPKDKNALGNALLTALSTSYDSLAIIEHAKKFDWAENAKSIEKIIMQHVTG